MKIMFVCHRFPFPPKRGGKIRPFNIIRHLTESGHAVTVGTLARSDEELRDGQGLTEYCRTILVGRTGTIAPVAKMIVRLSTPVPSSMGYFHSSRLKRMIRNELEKNDYDLIIVHCSSVAQYIPADTGIPSILDFGDMDSHKWLDYSRFKSFPLSLGYRLEGSKLLREEKRLSRKFTTSTCTTRAELETLQSYESAVATDWFPNGVDADYFTPSKQPYDPNGICFIGRMDYYPNQQAMLSFCENILPMIRAQRPSVHLTIVGAEPSKEILKLQEKEYITVTGTVPDVRDYVRSAALTVAPLSIARGTQNKILESMGMGVPVVCTNTAAGGVDAIPEEHFLTATDSQEFAMQTLRILDSTKERERLSAAARSRVLTNHSWPSSMQKLDGIIRDTLERSCAQRSVAAAMEIR